MDGGEVSGSYAVVVERNLRKRSSPEEGSYKAQGPACSWDKLDGIGNAYEVFHCTNYKLLAFFVDST